MRMSGRRQFERQPKQDDIDTQSEITIRVHHYVIRNAGFRPNMSEYRAPLDEIRFALRVTRTLDLCSAVREEEFEPVLVAGARLAEQVFAPLNGPGDREGCSFEQGRVTTPSGFRRAYSSYADSGWNAAGAAPTIGGQGLPFALTIALSEMFNSANLSLAMGLMPVPGAIELIDLFGSETQRAYYLPRLLSGEWTVTMALTEPQAGSDLGAIATQAHFERGSLLIRGQKTFITWGDHDLADNILHLVLARSPVGPPGVKGLSLYLVPKIRADGEFNDVKCVGIEKKIGLKASPTASLVFGDEGGASAELLGEENEGLRQMFVLLTQARLRVACFALGSAERARQAAIQYANFRVQGRDDRGRPTVIANHPDVRRMITSMEARTEAIRLLISYAAALVNAPSDDGKIAYGERKTRLEILTPIVKAWCTEVGFEVASTGLQIFGGVGYTEECEASQYFREARVHMIYEGTTGVQANDLISRKIARDGGLGAKSLFDSIRRSVKTVECAACHDLQLAREQLSAGLDTLEKLTATIARNSPALPSLQTNGAHYLMFAGTVLACWLLWFAAAQATAAAQVTEEFRRRKIRNARFLIEQYLAPAEALAKTVLSDQQLNSNAQSGAA